MDATTFWYLVGLGMVAAVTVSLIYLMNTRKPKERVPAATELPEAWDKFMPKPRPSSEEMRSKRSKPAHRRVGVKRKRTNAAMKFAGLTRRR